MNTISASHDKIVLTMGLTPTEKNLETPKSLYSVRIHPT